MPKPKYNIPIHVRDPGWTETLVAIGYPRAEKFDTAGSGPQISVENKLQDIGSKNSINQSGSGAFIKSASLDSPIEGLQDWQTTRRPNEGMGKQLGSFLHESVMKPYVTPGVQRFNSYLKDPDGLLPSALSGAALASVPAFLTSLGVRAYRGERNVLSTALRDAVLGGAVGAVAGGGLHFGEQSHLSKQASFSDSLKLTSAISNSSSLTRQQKAQLTEWVHGLAPEFLEKVLQSIGPALGAGAAIALWAIFSKQKGLAGGLLSAAAGGLMGHYMSQPKVPRDAFGNQILTDTGLYGKPYIL